jgi:general secretion pathway protein D
MGIKGSLWAGMVCSMVSAASAEMIMTAQDHAVDSDVVLESVLEAVKSTPRDTVNALGDIVTLVKGETVATANGVEAVFRGASPLEQVKKEAELAVATAWDASNDIIFRSYKVNDEIGEVLMTKAGETLGQSVDVSRFFDEIEFIKNTSAFYMPNYGSLLVRQTQANLLAIENVLADYQNARRELMGHQVEIEAKFVEVNQSTLNELGFRWRFGSGGNDDGSLKLFDDVVLGQSQDLFAGALRYGSQALNSASSTAGMMISKTTGALQWDLFISALERTDDTDVLSAPRVVTLDGNPATIRVGEEQMIPTTFGIQDSSSSPWALPGDWTRTLMGVELEVTPELREGGLIDLKILPTVRDLVGYDEYQIVPAMEPISGDDVVEAKEEVTTSLPYFRIRELSTQVTVADGSTVAMGGLIYDKTVTYRDKVPLLGSIPYIGRLFRSEGEKIVKRNLMVFVKATQVDLNGRKADNIALTK